MEDVQEKKRSIRKTIEKRLGALNESKHHELTKIIENRLFEFANFLEAKTVLLYMNSNCEVATWDIIQRSYQYNKIVVLPAFNTEKFKMSLMKVIDPDTDLKMGPRNILEPDASKCKIIPIDNIDIAIIPRVQAVFTARRGEDHTIFRDLFGQFGEVIASGLGAVATADEEEMTNLTPLDCLDDLVGQTEHRRMMKSRAQLALRIIGQRRQR